MNNPFSATRENLRSLLATSQRRFTIETFYRALDSFTRAEIDEQLRNQCGPIVDAIFAHSAAFAANTANVEIMTSLSLADFYWPHSETTISFELRNGVNPNSISTYEELVPAIENDTHVDCRITGDGETKDFQIKRFPFARIGNTNESFLGWLEESVLNHYGDMTGTILVVILQPNGRPEQVPLNPTELAESLTGMRDRITFDEVVLTYNDRGQNFALHKLYPEHRRILIPLDWGLARFRGDI